MRRGRHARITRHPHAARLAVDLYVFAAEAAWRSVCVEELELKTHRTKDLETALAKGLKVEGKTLLVADRESDNLERAARNNPRLTAVRALGISIVDLLDHDTLVVSEPALKQLAEVISR